MERPEPDRRDARAGPPRRCSRATARSASRPRGSGEVDEFRAEREVIVCGGAYNSPQLLMLSGIGPAEQLTAARDRGRCSTSRRSARTCRTTPNVPLGMWTTRRAGQPAASAATPEALAEFEADADRPADLERRPRAAASSARARGSTAPDVQFHLFAGAVRRRGPRSTRPAHGVLDRRLRAEADEPRQRARSRRPTRRPSRSSATTTTRRARHADAGRGHARGARDRAPAGAAAVLPTPFARSRRSTTRSALRAYIAREHADALPPDEHVRDRRRRRQRAARARAWTALRVVDASVMPTVVARQHERAVDRDRRAGRRPDPRSHDGGRRRSRAGVSAAASDPARPARASR